MMNLFWEEMPHYNNPRGVYTNMDFNPWFCFDCFQGALWM